MGRWYGGLLCLFPKAIGDVDKRSCALRVGVLRTNWLPLFAPRNLCEKCCRCRKYTWQKFLLSQINSSGDSVAAAALRTRDALAALLQSLQPGGVGWLVCCHPTHPVPHEHQAAQASISLLPPVYLPSWFWLPCGSLL